MKINVYSFGKNMPHWVKDGIDEYAKRFPRSISFSLIEVPFANCNKRTQAVVDKENEDIIKQINPKDCLIALDSGGKQLNSEEFSKTLYQLQKSNFNLSFLIGGPEGLSQSTLIRANEIWSLSKLTFPHMLARLILIEQIYRAYCFQTNRPYCKIRSK